MTSVGQNGLILALDFGGTKCHAMLFDQTGAIIGMGIGQGPEVSGRSLEATQIAIKKAAGGLPLGAEIRLAYNSPCCLSHLGRLPISAAAIKETFMVAEETAILELAGATCGIVVLSGTGAFVYGKDRAGRDLRLDGLGPVLGDCGGGYSIGLHALRAAAKSDWHPRYRTALRPRVFEYCGVKNIQDLILFSLKPHDRSIISGLAKIVDQEAQKGDTIALAILQTAADDIADILRTVLEILKMEKEQYKMIGTGSVIKSDIYWNYLCQKARHFAPGLEPVRPSLPEVFGVAFAALRRFQPAQAGLAAEKLAQQYQERKP